MTDNKKISLHLLQEIFSKQADIFKEQLQIMREFASSQVPTQPHSIHHDQKSLASTPSGPSQQIREPIKIAVIGMAGRFPGAPNVWEFWKNLNAGIESITTFRPEEIDLAVPAEERLHPQYGRSRGILEDADKFDAEFFRISPREAKLIDPQQRIFLEVSYEALQDAGYDPDQYSGEIGVYGGVGDNFYHINNVLDKKDLINKVGSLTTTVGNMKDYAATRVSYKLNLKGPSISLNTACSTSLVAIDQAVLGLRNFTCDMALAGASSIYVPQKAGFMFGPGSPFSSDGHIKPFSSDATGVMFSDGAGMVVLKRLDDATRDRDHIYGVIIGSAVNNDGTDKMSFFAPSSEGQCKVISKALRDAGVSPETLSFVEAHATGTMLGDPVEFEGLKAAFAPFTQKKNFCAIGAYKANVGHVDAAAGVAGLIKALLALKYKNLPRNINFKSVNPEINLADSPFFIPVESVPLKNLNGPLRAGVSAFGFGGTNAHVIIEESPPAAPSVQTKPLCLLLISAETDAAWHRNAHALGRHLKEHLDTALADVEYTLALGRKGFAKRGYILAKDRDEALGLLEQSSTQIPVEKHPQIPPLAFMFPGQGTQSLDMGRGLYKSSPRFRATVDHCTEILRPLIGADLREVIYPGPNGRQEAEERLEQTAFAQPALFVIQYAMAQMFLDLGFKPEALVGHSLGEITCATLSGVLSLEDALYLVAERGRLMQKMAPGSMLSVNLSLDDVQKILDETISVAAINGPKQCVLSGSQSSLNRIRSDLEHKGVGCRPLKTSHGFHSPTVEAIREDFLRACAKITFHPPSIPYVSTLTAAWITPGEAQNPTYWFQHMRQPVRFYDSVKTLWAREPYLLVELGPRETATLLARKASTDPDRYRAIPTLVGDDGYRSFAEAIGQIWTTGIEINWKQFFAPDIRNRVSLPTYSFEKISHWLETIPADPVPEKPNLTDLGSYKLSKQMSHLENAELPKISTPAILGVPSAGAIVVTESLKETVRGLFLEAAGISISAARERVGFLELGFDSLSLAQVSAGLKRGFSVDLPYGKIIRDKNTFEKLTQFLAQETGNTLQKSSSPTSGGISTQRIEENQAYPVSFSQRRMWMHSQVAPKATTYHIPLYFSIKGKLHPDRFRQSIEHCVGRHHILRSTYHLENGNIVQKFSSKIPLAYTEVDLSSNGMLAAKDQLEALLVKYARIPFQLDRESLIRFYLFKLAHDVHVFFLNAHHILFDLVSIQTFLTEIGQTYKSLDSGSTLENTRAPVQYIDFVYWQQNWAQSGAMEKQISYWREQLGSSPLPVLAMPTMTPRPAVQPEIDSHINFRIEKAPLRHLLDQTTQWGATPFTLLLATYNCFLMSVTGQRCVVVGTPIANRSHPETKNTIGFFANTLALKSTAQEEQTFREFLLQTRDQVLTAFEHQDAPIDEVIRQLPLHRNLSFNQLFQTFLSFEKVHRETYDMGKLSMDFMGDVSRAAPATDLNLWIEDHDGLFAFTVEFSKLLFQPDAVKALFGRFEEMLRYLAASPNLPLRDLFREFPGIHGKSPVATSGTSAASPHTLDPQKGEPLLETIVCDILGIPKLDWNASFQYQGGHSLLAVRLLEQINSKFSINLELRQLLQVPSIRALWLHIQGAIASAGAMSPKAAPKDSTLPSVHQMVTHACAAHGAKQAIRYRNKVITYNDLDRRSNQVARYLQAAGVRSGGIVGIAMDRSIELVVGMLGILKSGAAYLPMDPAYPTDRLVYMAENSDLKLILSEEEYVETLNMPSSVRLIAMDGEANAIGQCSDAPLELALESGSLAYVIYTSGSTGKPKGVQIPHSSAVTFLRSMGQAISFQDSDVLMALTTICFDISVLEIFLTLATGATLVLMDSENALDGKKLAQTIDEQGVSVFQATPSGWRILVESGWKGSPRLTGLCGGEAFPRDLAAKLIPLVKVVYNVYGPTEATVWATYNPVLKPEDHKFIGKPLDGYRIFIVDDKLKPVPQGEIGDLYIGGQALARGYINRSDLTAERFIASPFHPGEKIYQTGDRARFTDTGVIEYISRADDQVKIRGYRIELGEIESVANMFPPVKVSAAIVHEYAPGDQRIVLFVSRREGQNLVEPELKEFMRKSLPDYFIPNVFKMLDVIPLTQNGKIDKKTLKALCVAEDSERASKKDRSQSTEELLETLWKAQLKVDRINRDLNFFQAGGYSLLGIILAKEISEATGHGVTLADLLTLTFEQLVYRIDQEIRGAQNLSELRKAR